MGALATRRASAPTASMRANLRVHQRRLRGYWSGPGMLSRRGGHSDMTLRLLGPSHELSVFSVFPMRRLGDRTAPGPAAARWILKKSMRCLKCLGPPGPQIGENKPNKHNLVWEQFQNMGIVRGDSWNFLGLPGPRGDRKRIPFDI